MFLAVTLELELESGLKFRTGPEPVIPECCPSPTGPDMYNNVQTRLWSDEFVSQTDLAQHRAEF